MHNFKMSRATIILKIINTLIIDSTTIIINEHCKYQKINSKFIKKYIVKVKVEVLLIFFSFISKAFAAQDYRQFLVLACVAYACECVRVTIITVIKI